MRAAYFYWHGPTNSADPSALEDVVFDGNNLVGVFFGASADNCWGYSNSLAYRANVTPYVSGDGTYPFSFPGFLLDSIELNGASLVVIYDDGNGANNVDVAIFDGNDSNVSNPFDADAWNAALGPINYSVGSAFMTMIVSDGQGIPADPLVAALDDRVLVNGTEYLPLCDQSFAGDSVPNGPGCPFDVGCLWDHRTIDITAELVPGFNTLTLTSVPCEISPGVTDDCLSLVVVLFVLPEGSLGTPGIPAVGTLGVIILVVLLVSSGFIMIRRFS